MSRRVALFGVLGFFLLLAGHFYYSLRSTLPDFKNTNLKGLESNVRVEYDPSGVPSIHAASLLDAVRAQGYVVARDRLFQMELTRRKMQGRLSEVFGKSTLELDKVSRMFNFSKVASEAYALMPPENQKLLQAYAEGVNQWREENPSFEMKLLRITTEAWEPSHSLLVVLAMFQTLDRWDNQEEVVFNLLSEKYPSEVVEFLTQDFGFFDAMPVADSPKPLPPPGKSTFNYRELKRTETRKQLRADSPVVGSNAWAIPGSKTVTRKPILSGDPHLSITMPNLWYRNRLLFSSSGREEEIVGASIPGIPLVIIGTNGSLAWSFTNAYADTVDFVQVKKDECQKRTEKIDIRLGESIDHTFCETKHGPVLESDPKGQELAVQWAALDPLVLKDLNLASFNVARDIKTAAKILEGWSGPVQNCLLADSKGNTAWLVVGKVPNRLGFDGRRTVTRDANHSWKGYLSPSERQSIFGQKGQILSSGNQRTSPYGKKLYLFASSWPSPARGYRLQQVFNSSQKWNAESSSQVQLDSQSVVHVWYRDQLLNALKTSHSQWHSSIKELVKDWNGQVDINSAPYPFLKKYRLAVISKFLSPLIQDFSEEEKELVEDFFMQRDEWIAQLLKYKPQHWLPQECGSFEEVLSKVAEETAKELATPPKTLKDLRWGEVNKANYTHPLSKLFPFLSSLLDLPKVELNGDSLVPRVERPRHSASLRITVDLGDLKKSLYSQPGGQSGHPLSPNYKDQFETWYQGKSTPLYPIEIAKVVTLSP